MKRRDSKKPTPNRLSELKRKCAEFDDRAYRVCYIVGTRTVRLWRSFVRFTRVFWRPIAHLLYRAIDFLLLKTLRRVREEWARIKEDFAKASEQVSGDKAGRVRRILALPFLAVRRHRGAFRTMINAAAPALALIALICTVLYWQRADFSLELVYGGKSVGYIDAQEIYTNAAAMVENMVIDEYDVFSVERAPKLTLTLNAKTPLLSETAVRDVILGMESQSLKRAAGLYVDGQFCGAVSRKTLDALLNETLEAQADPNAAVEHVSFFQKIEITEGLYPTSDIRSDGWMRDYVAKLPIQRVHYETVEDTLPYSTITEEDPKKYVGYEVVKVKGQDGKHRVTEEVVTVDGVEQYRTVVLTEVIEAPINRVVVVGTKKYTGSSKPGDSAGNFVWPLPYTKVITTRFEERWGDFHGAIDISNGSVNGKPIIASDGGVVLEAKWHNSYGNYVLIDHGNGFKTRYAHCSKLLVKEGQQVSQGQHIANVGNTGYSYGAHLHFEIIRNGQLVDPLLYVKY